MKKIKIDNTDEYIYIDKLNNGFEVYMLPNYNVNEFYITLNTKYGSINTKFKAGGKEYDMPKGIAHFLEHLSFNMPDESVFDHYSKLAYSYEKKLENVKDIQATVRVHQWKSDILFKYKILRISFFFLCSKLS